jgi:P27 family predicted phage terminase small subunit
MGRKPIPTALHELHGNPGKRARNSTEPKPRRPDSLPSPPMHLRADACALWSELVEELHRLGMLTTVDLQLLAAYTTAWADYVEAERKILRFGLLTRGRDGTPVRNPALLIRNRAIDYLLRIGSEFGFSPASRPRLGRQIEPCDSDGLQLPGVDEFEAFLRSNPDRH